MYIVVTYIVRFIFYLVYLYGLWRLVQPVFLPFLRRTSQRIDYQARLRMQRMGVNVTKFKKRSWLYNHIDNLLYLAKNDYEPGVSFLQFTMKTILLVAAVFIVSLITIGDIPDQVSFNNPFQSGMVFERTGKHLIWAFPLFISALVAVFPYMRLRYVYTKKEIKASYDLIEVVKLLSKFTHLSIDAALGETHKLLTADNVLKRPIKVLSVVFSSYSNARELQQEIHRFSHAVGTTFAVNLAADLLYLEREGGKHLRESLIFLSESMEQQRETILNVRAKNRDAIVLGGYGNLLVLIVMCTSLAALLKWHVYVQLQFQTKVGLGFLSFIVSTIIISLVISSILSKPKLDYH